LKLHGNIFALCKRPVENVRPSRTFQQRNPFFAVQVWAMTVVINGRQTTTNQTHVIIRAKEGGVITTTV